MPGDFETMFRTIISQTGSPPISYVKVEVANVLSMVIPPKHQSPRGLGGDFRSHEDFRSNLVPDVPSLDDAPVADTSYSVKTVLIPDRSMEKYKQTSKYIHTRAMSPLV